VWGEIDDILEGLDQVLAKSLIANNYGREGLPYGWPFVRLINSVDSARHSGSFGAGFLQFP